MDKLKENCQARIQTTVQGKEAEKERLYRLHLTDRYWRLNHLYYILDEDGNKVLFEMNAVQYLLYTLLWWLNVIPKSRQHGITTFIAIFILDACLFNPDVQAGIIAHTLKDATKIFRNKILYAYNHLHETASDVKALSPLLKQNDSELRLSNNSSIYVGTSMRSGTLQYLHISEYGKLCARMPMKAEEIKTGAMETIHAGGMIFVESTAEGAYGDFYEMCKEAMKLKAIGKPLSELDYRVHFFAWFQKESNQTDPKYIDVDDKDQAYFDKLEQIHNVKINASQRAWFVGKKRRLKYHMYKEHPSTIEEAFIASVEGAYYAEEMAEMREQNRICAVPAIPDQLVHTVCDLGLGPNMPWIFFQVVGMEVHIVNCFNLSEKDDPRGGIPLYKRVLEDYAKKYRYSYGKHFCPFDIAKGEISTGQTVYDTAAALGIKFTKLDRELKVLDGITRLSNLMPRIYIDAEECSELITSWSSYHREWIENLSCYSEIPVHDKHSHFADAGRYLSDVIKKQLYLMDPIGMSKDDYLLMKEKHGY